MPQKSDICFVHPIFHFWFLVTFGDEVTKICNLCLHFARQGGQDGKNWKENHATKVTNDLSFASTETKFKNPITKTQNNFLVNTVFFCQIISKKAKMIISFLYEKIQK